MLTTSIGKIKLNTCIYNASGVNCITKKDLIELAYSNAGAVLSKSCTLESREGNPKPRYYDNDILSINSSGLPNLSYKYYSTIAEEISQYKPYMISVSGLTLEDNLHIVKYLNENEYLSGIELNLSCPNIQGKPQIGYDFETTDELLRKVMEIGIKKTFGLKLPPYFDMYHFDSISHIISKYKIDFLTCVNSLGNGLVIHPETDEVAIKPKKGHGGIGGRVIKAIALSNVRQFYERTHCNIIGCGGVNSGRDAYEHILCGASAVQIGTHLYQNGIKVFDQVSEELKKIMKEKGYKHIEEFKGCLKMPN